jgi:rSAM/selenodomain-associated transferase 2
MACRLLFFDAPVSHELNRYIWEGTILGKGFNPYLHAPNDPVLKPLVNDIWLNINHKDAPATYPPMAMVLFSLATRISASPVFFKILFLLFDLASILVLARMVHSRAQPLSWLMLYALNPLVLVLIAGEGRMDAMQVFFICLTFFWFSRGKDAWGFLALGCAIVSGYVALVLLPFVITSKNWKRSWALLIPAAAYVPFWASGHYLFTSLASYATGMHYNDSLTVILRVVFGPNSVWMTVAVFLMCMGIVFISAHDRLRSSFLVLGALLLLMPTLHPWYLMVVTPLLVFFPSSAWLYLHFAMVFTFPMMHVQFQPGTFQEIHWLKAVEYIPFYTLLIWSVMRPKKLFSSATFTPVQSVSVVIPTLNESQHIAGALGSLRDQSSVSEIMVVDGGSSDGTPDIAKRWGAKVIEAKKGRGRQIKVGVDHCHGDVILILHADCRIRESTLQRIREALNGKPECIGGSVGMRYQLESFSHRILALLNNGRARLTGISFGDQAQFFRKSALQLMGGYPDQMIMEDVELSMRMKENGLTRFIPGGVVVSERRWAKMGFFRNFTRVVTLCSTYLVQRRLEFGDAARRDLYTRYYNYGMSP